MFGHTEAITVSMARMALDAASMRHLAIANNIANVNTEGYTPVRVNFEQQMGAARNALDSGGKVEASMLAGIHPVLRHSAPEAGTNRTTTLDTEVADMAQNTVQYEALLKALGKHMAIMGAAISEGKR
jgi:flagellar basal-body rod protein FlgB